jgi:hypothetical protein
MHFSMAGNIRIAILVAGVTLFLASVASASQWDRGENVVGLAVAGAEWNIDEDFAGTKLIFDGQYAFSRKPGKPADPDDCCSRGERSQRYIGIVDAHLQWGVGQTGLEYAIVGLTGWGAQWEPEQDPSKKWQVKRDQVEFGGITFGFDDPLGIDSYTDVTVAGGSRRWIYRSSANSPFSFSLGLRASLGWAWVDSIFPVYKDVSNAYTGFGASLVFGHEKFGQLYTDDRINTGFTLGSPATNSSTSREARIRFGYFLKFYRCMALDVFIEKRSFNFADPVLPDLYTKSKRYGGEISCRFGKT